MDKYIDTPDGVHKYCKHLYCTTSAIKYFVSWMQSSFTSIPKLQTQTDKIQMVYNMKRFATQFRFIAQ